MPQLKKISSSLVLCVFPFFVTWTILGNFWISETKSTTPGCVSSNVKPPNECVVARARPLLLPLFLAYLLLYNNCKLPHPDHRLVACVQIYSEAKKDDPINAETDCWSWDRQWSIWEYASEFLVRDCQKKRYDQSPQWIWHLLCPKGPHSEGVLAAWWDHKNCPI
jgi:hypothetical protein